MLTFTAGASARRGTMETWGLCQGFHNSSRGRTGMEKKKKPSSPCTGQLSRLTSSPGGSWRIAELRERLSCLGCEIVENSQQGIKQRGKFRCHIPARRGKVWGAAQGTQGSRWVFWPSYKAFCCDYSMRKNCFKLCICMRNTLQLSLGQ